MSVRSGGVLGPPPPPPSGPVMPAGSGSGGLNSRGGGFPQTSALPLAEQLLSSARRADDSAHVSHTSFNSSQPSYSRRTGSGKEDPGIYFLCEGSRLGRAVLPPYHIVSVCVRACFSGVVVPRRSTVSSATLNYYYCRPECLNACVGVALVLTFQRE